MKALSILLLLVSSFAAAQTTVEFPATSVGTVTVWNPQSKTETLMGPAQGTVTIPSGLVMSLEVNDQGTTDVCTLQLPPIHRLQVRTLAPGQLARVIRNGCHELVLSGCAVTDADMALIAEVLPELQALSVDKSQVTDVGLIYASRMAHLRRLSLNECAISDLGAGLLGAMCSLRRLNLINTKISDHGVGLLPSGLESLQVSGPGITDDVIGHLPHFPNLKRFNVFGKTVSVEGYARIRAIIPAAKEDSDH